VQAVSGTSPPSQRSPQPHGNPLLHKKFWALAAIITSPFPASDVVVPKAVTIGLSPSGVGRPLPRRCHPEQSEGPMYSPESSGPRPKADSRSQPKPDSRSPMPAAKMKSKPNMPRQSSHQTKPNAEKSPRRDPTAAGNRDAAVNRIASHNYFLLEKFECGIVLTGTEVKSVRGGLANLKDSYGLIKDGELWLLNAHIGPYEHGNIHNHAPLRTRNC
jgi:hypothetical protein